MDANSKLLAKRILNKFICGFGKSKSFSPKTFNRANRVLKEILDSSNKWETRILTQEDAEAMNTTKADSYLAGDFIAVNIATINAKYADSRRSSEFTVEPRQLNVHLRKDDIKTRHKSKLSYV